MTEDEAKTKWCPFARVGHSVSGVGSLNRDVSNDPEGNGEVIAFSRCIASACMAWRLKRQTATVIGSRKGAEPFETDEPLSYETVEGWTVTRHSQEGFCGLAGPPQ